MGGRAGEWEDKEGRHREFLGCFFVFWEAYIFLFFSLGLLCVLSFFFFSSLSLVSCLFSPRVVGGWSGWVVCRVVLLFGMIISLCGRIIPLRGV